MCENGLLMELLVVEEASLDSTVNRLCSTVSRTPPTNTSCWGGFSSNTFWAPNEELDGLLEIAKELDDGICGVAVDLQQVVLVLEISIPAAWLWDGEDVSGVAVDLQQDALVVEVSSSAGGARPPPCPWAAAIAAHPAAPSAGRRTAGHERA